MTMLDNPLHSGPQEEQMELLVGNSMLALYNCDPMSKQMYKLCLVSGDFAFVLVIFLSQLSKLSWFIQFFVP